MIQQLDHDTVRLRIDARPEAIYDLVADVTRTPELSPEIVQCVWLDGATGPVVGARFKARNKMPNRPTFSNKPVVTITERGRTFGFARTEPFGGTVEWRYDFTPDGDGTLVTEYFKLGSSLPLKAYWLVLGPLRGRTNAKGMRTTLGRMKAVVEA